MGADGYARQKGWNATGITTRPYGKHGGTAVSE